MRQLKQRKKKQATPPPPPKTITVMAGKIEHVWFTEFWTIHIPSVLGAIGVMYCSEEKEKPL